MNRIFWILKAVSRVTCAMGRHYPVVRHQRFVECLWCGTRNLIPDSFEVTASVIALILVLSIASFGAFIFWAVRAFWQ